LLQEAAAIHAAHPGIHFASGPKYKIQAVVVPKTRPLPSDVASFLTRWQQHWGVDHDLESLVTHDALVPGQTTFTWMAVQDSLVPALEQVRSGEWVDLYIMFLGILPTGDCIFVINAFAEHPSPAN